jgi:hypothetical protein
MSAELSSLKTVKIILPVTRILDTVYALPNQYEEKGKGNTV